MTDADDIPEARSGTEPMPNSKGVLTSERIREIAERGKKTARERKRQNLLSDRQLTLWADAVRGAPNEIVRSALFTAKNRKQARENLKRAVVAVIGEGEITYTVKGQPARVLKVGKFVFVPKEMRGGRSIRLAVPFVVFRCLGEMFFSGLSQRPWLIQKYDWFEGAFRQFKKRARPLFFPWGRPCSPFWPRT